MCCVNMEGGYRPYITLAGLHCTATAKDPILARSWKTEQKRKSLGDSSDGPAVTGGLATETNAGRKVVSHISSKGDK